MPTIPFWTKGLFKTGMMVKGKPKIKESIREILSDLDVEDVENLSERGSRVRRLIHSLEFPREIVEEVVKAYRKLCKEYGEDTDVAVRSSATAEDLPGASFAGQQETYLNIRGEYALDSGLQTMFCLPFYQPGHLLQNP